MKHLIVRPCHYIQEAFTLHGAGLRIRSFVPIRWNSCFNAQKQLFQRIETVVSSYRNNRSIDTLHKEAIAVHGAKATDIRIKKNNL